MTCLFYGLFYDFVNRQVLSTPMLLSEFLSETASFLELEHELWIATYCNPFVVFSWWKYTFLYDAGLYLFLRNVSIPIVGHNGS